VEIPPGWSAINQPPPDALLAVQSPSQSERFLVFAAAMPAREHPNAAHEFWESAKNTMTKGGMSFGPQGQATIGDVSFATFTAPLSTGGTLTSYVGSLGDKVYMLQAISTAATSPDDSQLKAAVDSFHVLSPVPVESPLPETHSSRTAGFYVFVVAGGLLLGSIVFAVVAVLRWPSAKKPDA
jgi:hypothetical protein